MTIFLIYQWQRQNPNNAQEPGTFEACSSNRTNITQVQNKFVTIEIIKFVEIFEAMRAWYFFAGGGGGRDSVYAVRLYHTQIYLFEN